MYATKERNLKMSGTDKAKKEAVFLGTLSPDPWDLSRIMPIPVDDRVGGVQPCAPNPSLVLAPESALSLLPSRGLSSAPVVCSVSAMAVLSNHGTKKELAYRSAFRHVR